MKAQDRMGLKAELRVGLIGYGAIGRVVADAIIAGDAGAATLRAILERDAAKYELTRRRILSRQPIIFTADPDRFFGQEIDLVIEAAGQGALRLFARRVLESGTDLLICSVGAFTDEGFFTALKALAQAKGARMLLVSGALPAVDWMTAAALQGPCDVSITQSKPAASWLRTPAEAMADLDRLTEPTRFFQGSAREAASHFQKSSNITALLALCTAGLDNTQVYLVADPTSNRMHTLIEFRSDVGELRIEWRGVPSETNPSTSLDVSWTVVKALRNLASPVHYGI